MVDFAAHSTIHAIKIGFRQNRTILRAATIWMSARLELTNIELKLGGIPTAGQQQSPKEPDDQKHSLQKL